MVSPFIVVQDFISPLTCEKIIEDIKVLEPDREDRHAVVPRPGRGEHETRRGRGRTMLADRKGRGNPQSADHA